MSDHERLEVMLICKTFHTSATDLSKRYVKPNIPFNQVINLYMNLGLQLFNQSLVFQGFCLSLVAIIT